MKRVLKHSDIYGMSRIGYSGDYEIYVNTDDRGRIPHFHYRLKNDWSKFHTCICIEQAKYFHHTGKEDVLNAKQRKDFDSFMKSDVTIPRYRDKFNNNWELVCFMWDMNNSSQLIECAEMPNYLELR